MAFREKIELLIDVTTTGARSSLQSLKRDVDQADGAFGKVKAGASSAFGGMGNLVAGGVAAAGAAIAGFALRAVGDFQRVALQAGEMADKLGMPVDDASRLAEVAGDLGIELGTLETAIGRMNRSAATSPDKFDAIGAAIARNEDGTINVTETFKNAAEAIRRIPDAADRAAAAQEIFGKGWMGVAELIQGGARGITEAMASVENAKVIDEAEVEKARRFRDMMDSLKGRVETVALVIGEVLVDAIDGFEELGAAADEVLRWATFRDARQMIYDNLVDPIKAAGEEMEATFNGGLSDLIQGVKDIGAVADVDPLVRQFVALGEALQGPATGFAELGDFGADAIPPMFELGATIEDVNALIRDQADALNESVDAMRSAADSTIAADEAQEDFIDAVKESNRVAGDAEASAEDVADAVDDERDALRGAAEAAQRLAEDQASAAGSALSATGKVDAYNASLMANARYATPAARRAAYEYLVQLNGIPAEVATEILADVDAGRLAAADAKINTASRRRETAIVADAKTAQAEGDLNVLARTRTANVRVDLTRGAGVVFNSAGGQQVRFYDSGTNAAPGPGVAGERRPEFVNGRMALGPVTVGAGDKVTGGAETERVLTDLATLARNLRTAGGDTYVTNMSINTATMNAADVVRLERLYARRNGQ